MFASRKFAREHVSELRLNKATSKMGELLDVFTREELAVCPS